MANVDFEKMLDDLFKMQDKIDRYSKRLKKQYGVDDDAEGSEIEALLDGLSCAIGGLEQAKEQIMR